MKIITLSASVATLTLLAACGGGATVDNGFADIATRAGVLNDRWGAQIEDGDYSPLAAIPTTGSAAFSGSVLYAVDRPEGYFITAPEFADLASDIDLDVNFVTDAVTGSLTNFAINNEDEGSEVLTGSVAITASLDRTVDIETDYSIAGSIAGTLRSSEVGDLEVDGEILADMIGRNRGATAGFVLGSATSSEGSISVQGEFIAARR